MKSYAGDLRSPSEARPRNGEACDCVGRDPHVGNVFRPLDSAAFSRETTAGSRIGHARVAAMLRRSYALLRELITLEKYALDIGTRIER